MSVRPVIVLIDDDQDFCYITMKYLEAEGFSVEVISDGSTGDLVSRITALKPDLILLDIMMPDKDGFHCLKEIKEKRDLKDVPVIFVTSDRNIDSLVLGFDLGAVDYIRKPFRHMELKSRILSKLPSEKTEGLIRSHSFINLDLSMVQKELAQTSAWSDGRRYFERDNVKSIYMKNEFKINACVRRANRHFVTVDVIRDRLVAKCTCDAQSEICRHIVAVLLYFDYRKKPLIKKYLGFFGFIYRIKGYLCTYTARRNKQEMKGNIQI